MPANYATYTYCLYINYRLHLCEQSHLVSQTELASTYGYHPSSTTIMHLFAGYETTAYMAVLY